MNVTLVPFGNARISGSKVTCQHGENECIANSIEQCAQDIYPDFATHYEFIDCMENHGSQMLRYTESCAQKAGLDYSQIEACSNDADRVFKLQQKAADLTPSDHRYTPWIVVNNVLSKSDGDRLLEEVCAAYTGPKPAGCRKATTCSADW